MELLYQIWFVFEDYCLRITALPVIINDVAQHNKRQRDSYQVQHAVSANSKEGCMKKNNWLF